MGRFTLVHLAASLLLCIRHSACGVLLIIKVKRVYAPAEPSDGRRPTFLVDRTWPRGVRKAAAEIDPGLKDAGPSTELPKWFGQNPQRWAEFGGAIVASWTTDEMCWSHR